MWKGRDEGCTGTQKNLIRLNKILSENVSFLSDPEFFYVVRTEPISRKKWDEGPRSECMSGGQNNDTDRTYTPVVAPRVL